MLGNAHVNLNCQFVLLEILLDSATRMSSSLVFLLTLLTVLLLVYSVGKFKVVSMINYVSQLKPISMS